MTANGTSNPQRTFKEGAYTPLVTPFNADGGVNTDALRKQVLRLARAGMGIVLLGTNGEASHLSAAERKLVVQTARQALDSDSDPAVKNTAILAGTGAGSANETIVLCKDAKEAGADFAIVIEPGYFAFVMGKDKAAHKQFFLEVFDKSPIPVMIYNFPGAASGIDLDSDLIIELSEHPNCFGVKLTCAAIGKGHRIAAYTQSKEYRARHALPFAVLPGYSDYLFASLIARQTGCITGSGNLFPNLVVATYNAAAEHIKSPSPETLKKARDMQDILTEVDWVICKAGISGTKYGLDVLVEQGMGGVPRLPLTPASDATKESIKGLSKYLELEKSLSKKA